MRIVSLCPSITETLVELGLAASLVGVTRFCIHPRAVTRALPKVGGTKDPDLEAIDRAAPDLVLMNEEENTREAFQALAQKYRVDASFPRRVADVPGVLRHLGRLTGTEAAAEARAAELEAELAALDLARAERGGRVGFAYLVWRDPWMAAGGDTYVSDLLERAGGENRVPASPARYPTLSLEALRALSPALLLLPDEPYPFRDRDAEALGRVLPGVACRRVSGDDLSWHGVRSVRGVRLARALLSPGLPVSPPGC